MTTDELIRTRHKGSLGLGAAYTYRADDALAVALPALALPRMGEAARAALRAALSLEIPYNNAQRKDCLALAEARGFSTDPRDWVPDFKAPGRHLPLYQPWVDWLSDHGLTPIHAGNTLTAENLSRWTPAALGGRSRVWRATTAQRRPTSSSSTAVRCQPGTARPYLQRFLPPVHSAGHTRGKCH